MRSGRDAILEADMLANGGANQCLIWEAFARRGLGLSASQGSANSLNDQTEAFDVPQTPNCLLASADRALLHTGIVLYPKPRQADRSYYVSAQVSGECKCIYT